jgi:hypothetical protein
MEHGTGIIPECSRGMFVTAVVASFFLSWLEGNLTVCSRRKAGSRLVDQHCQIKIELKQTGSRIFSMA